MGQERYNEKAVKGVIAHLKRLRAERQMSQVDVYIETDINVARIEAGRGNVSISTIADLCKFYKISLGDFFKDIEND